MLIRFDAFLIKFQLGTLLAPKVDNFSAFAIGQCLTVGLLGYLYNTIDINNIRPM